MRELDDDDVQELADLYGVEPQDVEAWLSGKEEAAEERELAREEAELQAEEAEEFADDAEELASEWGVTPGDVEALYDVIGDDLQAGGSGLSADELRDYIDDLYDQLTEEGWDLDVSDLWDMYYGYTPGGES